MSKRLERVLYKLAQKHAPHLAPIGWEQRPNYLKQTARLLAEYDLLILAANVPQHLNAKKDQLIQDWANAYAQFHNLLAQSLFPSYAALNASFADELQPPIIVFQANISPVVEAMAGYLVPYVASRQAFTRQPDEELNELMTVILQSLVADNLAQPIYNMLLQDGIANIRALLALPIQHIALTDFDRPLFKDVPKPPTLPKAANQPAQITPPAADTIPLVDSAARPTDDLPLDLDDLEQIEGSALTPTERMFIRPVDLQFKRKPPVPPPPFKPKKP